MPTIQFIGGSNASSNNTITRWTTTSGIWATGNYSMSGNATYSKLNVYKGSIADWSTFTSVSSRSSDLLIQFAATTTTTGNVTIGGITYYQFKVGIGSSTVASASGTATWFLLYSNITNGDLTTAPGMIGTVGISGSDADLIINSTSITSGQSYTSSGIILNYPISWNV